MYSILIIDDEPIVKIALRSILPWEEHGFFICGTASNGLEAVPLIEKHHPDIIITDLKMPEMDGLELIRFLKEKEYPGEILVLSNYEDFDSVRSALLLGAADYLLKIKIQPDTLLACLNKTTKKMQNTADRKDSILKTDITEPITDHLLSFFQGEESLDSFIERYGAEKFGFMKHSCAVCYVTFEKFLSNDAFSICATLSFSAAVLSTCSAVIAYIPFQNVSRKLYQFSSPFSSDMFSVSPTSSIFSFFSSG